MKEVTKKKRKIYIENEKKKKTYINTEGKYIKRKKRLNNEKVNKYVE